MVGLVGLVSTGLKAVEDGLVELDVELHCLRFELMLLHQGYIDPTETIDDPRASKSVVRQRAGRSDSLDAAEQVDGKAQGELRRLRPRDKLRGLGQGLPGLGPIPVQKSVPAVLRHRALRRYARRSLSVISRALYTRTTPLAFCS